MSSSREYYEGLLNNPNAQRGIRLISWAEGTDKYKDPYRVGFGGTYISDLSQHPQRKYAQSFTQTNGQQNTSSAAGRAQWMPNTWNPLARRLGLTDFSPRSQDIATLAKIDERGGLQALLKGDVDTFAHKVRREWASFPGAGYAQKTRSMEQLRKAWENEGGTAPQGGYREYSTANTATGNNANSGGNANTGIVSAGASGVGSGGASSAGITPTGNPIADSVNSDFYAPMQEFTPTYLRNASQASPWIQQTLQSSAMQQSPFASLQEIPRFKDIV